jgi:hypothetical protein
MINLLQFLLSLKVNVAELKMAIQMLYKNCKDKCTKTYQLTYIDENTTLVRKQILTFQAEKSYLAGFKVLRRLCL